MQNLDLLKLLIAVLFELTENLPENHMILYQHIPHLKLENVVAVIWLQF